MVPGKIKQIFGFLLILGVLIKDQVGHCQSTSERSNGASSTAIPIPGPSVLKKIHLIKSRDTDPSDNDLDNSMQSDGPYGYPWPYPQETITLGSQSHLTSPCATILTRSNCILQVPDDAVHQDVSFRNFIFTAALVKGQCVLAVKHAAGTYSVDGNHLTPLGIECSAASVCCECNGCSRPNLATYDNSCAALFENERCSQCNGFQLHIAQGDATDLLDPLVDKKASSIYVLPGCNLTIYKESNFQGDAALVQGPFDNLPPEWDNVISSYRCDCLNNSPESTTTSFPPIVSTISPIETTTLSLTTTTIPTTTSAPTVPQTTEPPTMITPVAPENPTTTEFYTSTTFKSTTISTTTTPTTTFNPLTTTTTIIPSTAEAPTTIVILSTAAPTSPPTQMSTTTLKVKTTTTYENSIY